MELIVKQVSRVSENILLNAIYQCSFPLYYYDIAIHCTLFTYFTLIVQIIAHIFIYNREKYSILLSDTIYKSTD